MSGTSLDGVDIAYCEFEKIRDSWSYIIIAAETFEYDAFWKSRLKNVENLTAFELCETDINYGHFLGLLCKEFIKKHRIKPDFVSSHGHTIFHQPIKNITLQIGNGAAIAAESGLTVICDFRSMDVALGGHGAPLVPVGDKILFNNFGTCVNIGGFANISYDKDAERIAYDICPANIVLNHYSEKLGFLFDENGSNARKGKSDLKLLDQLNSIDYYAKHYPKSLAKEWVIDTFFKISENSVLQTEDILSTITRHIAFQISKEIDRSNSQKALITGGGAFNQYLIELIRGYSNNEIIIPDHLTINYKEALIFAFLGVLRFNNEINCLSSVTGASKDNIGGAIYFV